MTQQCDIHAHYTYPWPIMYWQTNQNIVTSLEGSQFTQLSIYHNKGPYNLQDTAILRTRNLCYAPSSAI